MGEVVCIGTHHLGFEFYSRLQILLVNANSLADDRKCELNRGVCKRYNIHLSDTGRLFDGVLELRYQLELWRFPVDQNANIDITHRSWIAIHLRAKKICKLDFWELFQDGLNLENEPFAIHDD